eukprot:TRINITY_DN5303_c0_g2_i1.p1 TRINITY_DN5303_c0_g2~~TRINITY_DN5303_c0_g2_i1.p1  ORF type:complete len:137 (+),score=5.45 TRINITY_DN5303_c0_g2_i1:81-491(+)
MLLRAVQARVDSIPNLLGTKVICTSCAAAMSSKKFGGGGCSMAPNGWGRIRRPHDFVALTSGLDHVQPVDPVRPSNAMEIVLGVDGFKPRSFRPKSTSQETKNPARSFEHKTNSNNAQEPSTHTKHHPCRALRDIF